jgi:hypothetical protein
LDRQRAQHSPGTFNWLSVLATVEVQLVLRCLDTRSRLLATRCNKQLHATVSHPFAWPQEHLVSLRVSNEAAAFQALGARVRGSLLRLSAIHLHVHVPNFIVRPFCPEVVAVPNVHAIAAHQDAAHTNVPTDFFLSFLRHPSAQQLRIFDIDRIFSYRCASAELEQLQTFPHLHSLSLRYTACRQMTTFQRRKWDELHQLPTHLPRVRFVEDDLTDVK